MSRIFTILLFLVSANILAQKTDSIKSYNLQDVIITSFREERIDKTTLNITSLKTDSLSKYGNYNLTDMLAKTPGVSMLSTGIAIAKPVIRGLYGNRIMILLSGLRFDNQQWQDEHGLGMSDLGLDRIELIKGPLGVLYGTEAIGGIINLIEEKKPDVNGKESDYSLRFNSNTLGGLIQGGYKENHGSNWFRIRIGIENNADYSDGNDKRVLNSRFDGYYLKATYGFMKKKWTSTNNLLSSFNRFGFIFNDIYTFITPDDRWSRNLSEFPAHLVLLNCFSSENKILLKNSSLDVNFGVQSNRRMEKEGGGAISLDMHLLTIQYLVKWEKTLSDKNKIIVSHLNVFEDNTNYGARKIIPDAFMLEPNISLYLETKVNEKVILENGGGIGLKWIKTFFTPTVNSPEKEIAPFTKNEPYYNFLSGITYFPSNNFNFKFNVSTGVRVPNLAELSSNGLHEGIFTYEVGSPLLKNEQIVSANLYCNYSFRRITINISPFYNHFFNYVYLSPSSEQWFGFPKYFYKQRDVNQYGTELRLSGRIIDKIETGISYSGMISKATNDEFIPFTPAQKISPDIEMTFEDKKNRIITVFTNADIYLDQDDVAPDEISTPGYWLLNLGASIKTSMISKETSFSISANNLLNTAYYDHLSRFKYFNLLNIGRNITVTYTMKFLSSTK